MGIRYEISAGVGFNRHGKLIPDVEQKINTILERASRLFGGAAIIPIRGGWMNPAGMYVREAGIVLRIDDPKCVGGITVAEFALDVKDLLDQETVMVTLSDVTTTFL